jgi:hypothetical protein
MKKWLRSIRGAFGIGLTWGAAWFAAGLAFMVVAAPHPENPFFVAWGALGFVAGITFAGLLGIIERRRGIDQLSLKRVAGWGAAGGLSLAIVVQIAGLSGDFLLLAPLFALAGAGCAAGTLALARKGDEQHLLHSGASLSDPVLTARERRKLP